MKNIFTKMNRFLFFVMFFAFSSTASPQLFQGGICGGLVGSQIDGDYLSGYHKLGITAGTYINTRLNPRMAIQLELKYIQKGVASYSQQPSIFLVSLHYVEIPVLAQLAVTEKISVEMGASMSYLMGLSGRDAGGSLEPLNAYAKQDYNVLLGISYQISNKLIGNFRYAYSLVPVREHNTGRYRGFIPDVLNLKDGDYNNLITLSLYYQIAQ